MWQNARSMHAHVSTLHVHPPLKQYTHYEALNAYIWNLSLKAG